MTAHETAGGRRLWILAALVLAAGAALRFATLGHQSLWLDEGLTRNLVIRPFGDMVDAVADTENTPPLFYVLTHLVTQVVGTGEAGLRLLSAVCGVATIGVALLAGRELGGERAGVGAAVLVAVSPMLVWFSQEARSYALLVLLAATALLFFLRARRTGSPRDLAGWAVASALALVTHYFAVFPTLAEAALLLWAVRGPGTGRRPVLLAAGGVLVALAAIAPVAISQEGSGRAESISHEDLGRRIAQVPKQFLVGYDGPHQTALAVASALLLALAAAGLWRIRDRPEVRAVAMVAAATVLVPVAAAFVGADYLYTRNVLPGLVPVLVLAGAGFAALPGRWVGAAGAAALALAGMVTVVGVDRNEAYQRADWRALSGALGERAGPRLLVVSPGKAEVPLGAYRAGAAIAPPGRARVREIDVAAVAVAVNGSGGGAASPPRPATAPAAPPGFALAARELRPTYTLYRYRAPRPVTVAAAPVAAARLNSSFSLLLLRR